MAAVLPDDELYRVQHLKDSVSSNDLLRSFVPDLCEIVTGFSLHHKVHGASANENWDAGIPQRNQSCFANGVRLDGKCLRPHSLRIGYGQCFSGIIKALGENLPLRFAPSSI